MHKHIFRILLIVVMVFSITACSVSNTDASTQYATIESTIETTTPIVQEEQKVNPDDFKTYDEKIEIINLMVLLEMTQEEVSESMANMVTISSTEELAVYDMVNMAHNFNNIASFVSSVDATDFEIQATNAFNNVYNQAIKQQIPLENLSGWTSIPVVDIQLKYFSGEFSSVENITCKALYYLDEHDAFNVAETIFSNRSFFKKSGIMVYDALMCPHYRVQLMGLAALTSISKTSDSISSTTTFNICKFLVTNSIINDVLTLEKLEEIRENIIKNENFDFITKYVLFCNSDDEEVSNWACSQLTEIAKQADLETAEQIREVTGYLWNEDFSNKLLYLLEEQIQ